jgi:hypothetical protein
MASRRANSADRSTAARGSGLVAAGLVVAALSLAPLPALAASCATLSADLARLSAASGQSPQYRKWQKAAREQSSALSLAERDARLLGCASGSSASCASLATKIKRMRSNLRAIERQRDRHADTGTAARRKRVARDMRRNGCNERPAATTSARRSGDGGGLLAFLGISSRERGQPVAVSSGDQPAVRSRVRIEHSGGGDHMSVPLTTRGGDGTTYRTVCVRICDGFYFPVSFATGEQGFGRDSAICRARCPGADTQLFVHRNPGETAENLVALDGTPYADLPNANRFRTTYVSDCGCRSAGNGRQSLASLTRSGDDLALDSLRQGKGSAGFGLDSMRSALSAPGLDRVSAQVPDGADPDTRMNIELGYAALARPAVLPVLGRTRSEPEPEAEIDLPAPQPANVPQTAVSQTASDAQDRAVRIVGPRYYIAQ